MSVYNFSECSDNNSKSLKQYCRNVANGPVADPECFRFNLRFTGNTYAAGTKGVE